MVYKGELNHEKRNTGLPSVLKKIEVNNVNLISSNHSDHSTNILHSSNARRDANSLSVQDLHLFDHVASGWKSTLEDI